MGQTLFNVCAVLGFLAAWGAVLAVGDVLALALCRCTRTRKALEKLFSVNLGGDRNG